ncbi:UNVERIFIED_CONTAM: hypothetical protein HHA_452910 [Hammondia hammondi]|eukprot:XP_008886129.1 hypothetical protein HHA_452910 [Hammondia hammondi]
MKRKKTKEEKAEKGEREGVAERTREEEQPETQQSGTESTAGGHGHKKKRRVELATLFLSPGSRARWALSWLRCQELARSGSGGAAAAKPSKESPAAKLSRDQ